THAHEVFGLRVRYLPRAMAEDKERLKEGDHHALPHAVHDEIRKQYNVVSAFRTSIRNYAGESIGTEVHIGVGKTKPLPRRGFRRVPHGMRFPQTVWRQRRNMDTP